MFCKKLFPLLVFLVLVEAENEVTAATGSAYNYLGQLGGVICIFLVIPFLYYTFGKKEADLIPSSSWKEENQSVVVKFDMRYFVHTGWIGPVFGLFTSIVYSMLFHYDDVTKTHCNVPNPLPSVSAAIGNNIPERWFMRLGVLIMAPQRILDCYTIFVYFKRKLPPVKFYHILNILQFSCNLAENFSLWVVTYISSTEYYPFHEKGFILWTFFQLVKSFITLYLYPLLNPGKSAWSQIGFRHRVYSLVVNIAAMGCAAVVFYLHFTHCYPYMYAAYAFCEYTIICSNIYFNFCVIWEYPTVKYKNMMFVITKSPHFSVPTSNQDKL